MMKAVCSVAALLLAASAAPAQSPTKPNPFDRRIKHFAAAAKQAEQAEPAPLTSHLIVYSVVRGADGVTYRAVVRTPEGATYFLLGSDAPIKAVHNAGIYDATMDPEGKFVSIHILRTKEPINLGVTDMYAGSEAQLPPQFRKPEWVATR
jgi:hypothetical protein